MKKIIIAMMLLVCSSSLFAQNVDSYGIPTNSLNVEVADGLVPTAFAGVAVGLGVAIGASMAAVISGGNATIDGPQMKGFTPFFSAGWEHHFPNTRWSIGPEVGYWHAGLAGKDSYQHFHFTTLNAAAKLYYKPAGICKLYGGLNLGVGMILTGEQAVTPATKADEPTDGAPAEPETKDGPSILPTFQFNPIGMRLGSEKVAFLAELGIGYKGFLQLGINVAL